MDLPDDWCRFEPVLLFCGRCHAMTPISRLSRNRRPIFEIYYLGYQWWVHLVLDRIAMILLWWLKRSAFKILVRSGKIPLRSYRTHHIQRNMKPAVDTTSYEKNADLVRKSYHQKVLFWFTSFGVITSADQFTTKRGCTYLRISYPHNFMSFFTTQREIPPYQIAWGDFIVANSKNFGYVLNEKAYESGFQNEPRQSKSAKKCPRRRWGTDQLEERMAEGHVRSNAWPAWNPRTYLHVCI